MTCVQLAMNIIDLINSADDKVEQAPESDWYGILREMRIDIKGLCHEQLIQKSNEDIRITDIHWTRANGSRATFSSSNDEEIEEKLTGLFFLSIQGKIRDLTIEH